MSTNKKNYSVFLFQLLQIDYEVWEIIIYFTTCFSFWHLFYSLPTFCTKYLEVGPLADIFFSAEDYTNVVLDQSTVTFQKGWGYKLIPICVVLDQNHGNAMFYQLGF